MTGSVGQRVAGRHRRVRGGRRRSSSTQGNITPTGNPLDLAINGNGFFQVQNTANQIQYTRNGQFKPRNANGNIVNDQGNKLVGYPADASTATSIAGRAPCRCRLPTGRHRPACRPTDVNDGVQPQFGRRRHGDEARNGTPAINFKDQSTYNDATSVTMYDAKGQNVAVSYYFQKTATDTVEPLRHGQRQDGRRHGRRDPQPDRLPARTRARRQQADLRRRATISLDIPASTNDAGAETLPITGISARHDRAPPSSAPTSASPTWRRTATRRAQLTGVSVDNERQAHRRSTPTARPRPPASSNSPTSATRKAWSPIGGNAWQADHGLRHPHRRRHRRFREHGRAQLPARSRNPTST